MALAPSAQVTTSPSFEATRVENTPTGYKQSTYHECVGEWRATLWQCWRPLRNGKESEGPMTWTKVAALTAGFRHRAPDRGTRLQSTDAKPDSPASFHDKTENTNKNHVQNTTFRFLFGT